MRDGDRRNTAQGLHRSDAPIVDEADAIPQNVAGGGTNVERPLGDRELRLRPYADELRPFHIKLILVSSLHLLQRGPLLPGRGHELPVILADSAVFGWKDGVGVLYAASDADVFGHGSRLQQGSDSLDRIRLFRLLIGS